MNAVTINNEVNLVTNEAVAPYVSEFNTLMNKSAEAVLEMGRVVLTASKKLSKSDFEHFCSAVRADVSSSLISKLKKIGSRYERLIQYKADLPSAWTTLYHLARITDEDFEKGIQQQLIHKTMTASELRIVAPGKGKSSAETSDQSPASDATPPTSTDITIKWGAIPDATERSALIAVLESLCPKYHCEIVAAQ